MTAAHQGPYRALCHAWLCPSGSARLALQQVSWLDEDRQNRREVFREGPGGALGGKGPFSGLSKPRQSETLFLATRLWESSAWSRWLPTVVQRVLQRHGGIHQQLTVGPRGSSTSIFAVHYIRHGCVAMRSQGAQLRNPPCLG